MRFFQIIVFLVAPGLFGATACSHASTENTSDTSQLPDTEAPDTDASLWETHYTTTGKPLNYSIFIEESDWQAMLADPLCEKGGAVCGSEYVPARFVFEGREFAQVGVRFKGNSSLSSVAKLTAGQMGYQRYSFKIKFDKYVEGQTLDGIKTLNLNNSFLDPSQMREALSYELFRKTGVPASRTGYAALSVNGKPYGLYVSVQEVDKIFLKQWFGDDNGNLYKPEYGDLVYKGETIDQYAGSIAEGSASTSFSGAENYVKKTNESKADYTDIIFFMKMLQQTPAEKLQAVIEPIFDVERFLSYLAVHVLIVSLDSYAGGLPQNYYLYHDTSSGKFVFIPWDLNNSFGTFNCFILTPEQVLNLNIDAPLCLETPNALGGGNMMAAEDRPLFSQILSVPAYKAKLHEKIVTLLAETFTETVLGAQITTLHTAINEAVAADTHPFYSVDDFNKNLHDAVAAIPGLSSFIQGRIAAVKSQLAKPVICGDGICDSGEICSKECTKACTATCEVFFQPANQCVPSCKDGCICPPTSPDGKPLVCDTALGICHP